MNLMESKTKRKKTIKVSLVKQRTYAVLAQSVERKTFNLVAEGSTPSDGRCSTPMAQWITRSTSNRKTSGFKSQWGCALIVKWLSRGSLKPEFGVRSPVGARVCRHK